MFGVCCTNGVTKDIRNHPQRIVLRAIDYALWNLLLIIPIRIEPMKMIVPTMSIGFVANRIFFASHKNMPRNTMIMVIKGATMSAFPLKDPSFLGTLPRVMPMYRPANTNAEPQRKKIIIISLNYVVEK